MINFKEFLRDELRGSVSHLTAKAIRLQAILDNFDNETIYYRVRLRSGWELHGEKNIDTKSKVSLERAVVNAIKKFKKINNRSDVQADWTVTVLVDDEEHLIPEEHWKHLRKLGRCAETQRLLEEAAEL